MRMVRLDKSDKKARKVLASVSLGGNPGGPVEKAVANALREARSGVFAEVVEYFRQEAARLRWLIKDMDGGVLRDIFQRDLEGYEKHIDFFSSQKEK